MTQTPHGASGGWPDQEPVPARAADPVWDEPVTYDPATTGGLADPAPIEYETQTYEPAEPISGGPEASDVAKSEAADLKDTATDKGQQVAGVAKDQAAEVKNTALDEGQQVADVAKQEATKVKTEAVSQAKDLLAQSRSELSTQAGTQQQRLATIVHGFADELGSMASSSDASGPLTDLAHQGARRGSEIAEFLQSSEPSDVLEQVRSFARRRPVVFLAGSVLAGVVVGRLTRGLVADAKQDQGADVGSTVPPTAGTTPTSGYSTGALSGPGYVAPAPGGYESGVVTEDPYLDTPGQGGYSR